MEVGRCDTELCDVGRWTVGHWTFACWTSDVGLTLDVGRWTRWTRVGEASHPGPHSDVPDDILDDPEFRLGRIDRF